MTVDVIMLILLLFVDKTSNLKHIVKAQRVHNFISVSPYEPPFSYYLENESPQTGSHLQILVEESVL